MTRSGIRGVAGDETVRTGADSTHALAKTWNTDTLVNSAGGSSAAAGGKVTIAARDSARSSTAWNTTPRRRECDGSTVRSYRIRLNQNSDNPADRKASSAAPSAKSADTSVSFFSTVRRELSVS